MLLRTAIEKVRGLSYMLAQLNIQSPVGRRALLSTPFTTNADELQRTLDEVEQLYRYLQSEPTADALRSVQAKLAQLRDISGTIERLIRSSTLDDIELFEVKYFCLLTADIEHLLSAATITTVKLPALDGAAAILDPEGQRIPHFYIYDAYSEDLKQLRLQHKQAKQQENDTQAEQLYQQCVELEDNLRSDISARLHPFAKRMQEALAMLAQLDILIAKAQQATTLGLTNPHIAANGISYTALFNPQVKATLAESGKHYQPIDIEIDAAPCLITGANMSGKTLLLKTLCLAQYLFQYGFFVPAGSARIAIVDGVITSIDDEQEELKGLSSFASEMLTINRMLTKASEGKRLLLLIDELARTTNPTEGLAIVNATIDMLSMYSLYSIITTHYSGVLSSCKRLRVKGFIEEQVSEPLTQRNINDYIDYSLVPDSSSQAPMDALRVASLLGVSKQLIDKAKQYIKKE